MTEKYYMFKYLNTKLKPIFVMAKEKDAKKCRKMIYNIKRAK